MFPDDNNDPPTIVYERLQRGPLSGELPGLATPRLPSELRRPRPLLSEAVRRLSWSRRLELAVQIAHELAILHRC